MPDIRNKLQEVLLPIGVTTLLWLLLFNVGLSWFGDLPSAPNAEPENPIYYVIKGSIFWVPLGFLFSLAGWANRLQRWLLSGVVTFALLAAFFGSGYGIWDYIELLFALIGSWVGMWLGNPTRWQQPEAEAAPVQTSGISVSVQHQFPWLRLPVALVLLGLAIWAAWSFPRWPLVLAAGLLVYFTLLLRYRHAWLALLPALLPTLCLAPWTGRLSLDEFDLVLIVTLSGAIYHGIHPDSRPLAPRPVILLLSGYALLCIAALFNGLFPVPDLDINSFDNYFSRFNSMTIAKGFLSGFLFLGLVRWTLPAGSRILQRLFIPGLMSGLFIVALVGLRERWQYADLLDFSVPYRITATFYSMHTGGAHLDAYLALLVPIIGYWMVGSNRLWVWAAGSVLFSLAVYLVISTVTRTTFVVLVGEMILLIIFLLKGVFRSRGRGLQSLLAGLLILAAVLPVLYLGLGGSFFQQRMDLVERDSEVRLKHWTKTLEMMDRDFLSQTFGMGFGRFPAIYLERHHSGVTPGRHEFQQTNGNTFVRLYPGKTMYLAQKVSVSSNEHYRLALDVKSRKAGVTVSVPLCEKHLLNSKQCNWMSHQFGIGDDQWHHWEIEFNSGEIGKGSWLTRMPTELFLYNPNETAAIEVDNVSLQDTAGNEMLNNGQFDKGGDYWFLKTHQHLPWHIKNLWVSALFEQGWLGVTILTLLIISLMIHLFGPAWYSGHHAAGVVFVTLAGFCATGLFASPFDAPRITMLFFSILSFGLYETSAAMVNIKRNPADE